MSSPSAEAGTSTSPPATMFKKRGRSSRPTTTSTRISSIVDDPAAPPSAPTEPEEAELSVQDLLLLRSTTRKPTGIELERLNRAPSSSSSKQRNKSAKPASEEEESDKEENGKGRLKRHAFQSETGTVDVDKHMMAYIEAQVALRTGSTSSAITELEKVKDPTDELFAVAEKYRALSRSVKPEQSEEEREGNVALSSAMLTSIPEVDLGMESRLRNIEDTEKAKRGVREGKREERGEGEQYRFQKQGPRQGGFGEGRGQGGGERGVDRGRKQMATDQVVLDRFKKRQRNFR